MTIRLRNTTPVFLVANIAATMEWYRNVLGFSARAVPEQPPHVFGILQKDDVEIMLQALAGYRSPDHYAARAGGVWNVYLRVDGVRELYAALSQRSDVEILEPLCVKEYGQVEFVVRDPNGYTLVFGEEAAVTEN